MVIFQDDRSATEHALNATRSALAIQRQVKELNEEFAGVFQPVSLHMGINSGPALVGASETLLNRRSALDLYGVRSSDEFSRPRRWPGYGRRDPRDGFHG